MKDEKGFWRIYGNFLMKQSWEQVLEHPECEYMRVVREVVWKRALYTLLSVVLSSWAFSVG